MNTYNSNFFINVYNDPVSTSSPQRSNVRWDRSIQGIACSKPTSREFDLAPNETKTLFDGTVAISQDLTTRYTIAPSLFNPSLWALTWSGGADPVFRTNRTGTGDSTTVVQITLNGGVATYTSIGGTPFALAPFNVIVGDIVFLQGVFSPLNQGFFTVVAVTPTSFSVVNPSAVAQTVILGSSPGYTFFIYSAAGVQNTDTLSIFQGFSPASYGAYQIVNVYPSIIEFSSTASLPTQTVTTEVAIYSEARNFIYLEADQHCLLTINGIAGSQIGPRVATNGVPIIGQYLQTSTIWSLEITNLSLNPATPFLIALE